jgi:hypothetical protein
MQMNNWAVGLLSALCVTAGASGAYLVMNQSRAASADSSQTEQLLESPAGGAVEQSEVIVTESEPSPPVAAPVALAPAVAPAAPATRRTPAPRRPASVTPSRPQTVERPPARTVPAPGVTVAPAVEERPAVSAPLEEPSPVEVEAAAPAEPPAPVLEELVVSADSVIGLTLNSAVTTERARVEDEVLARVTRDVKVGDRVAIPEGSTAYGEVTLVERGGKMRERARLGIRFTTVVLADGTRVPIETDTIYREGDSPVPASTAKIGGGAIGGAIIGGILGGTKGAILGGSAGAGAGAAAVLVGGSKPASVPAGEPVTVRILKPVTVTVEN